MARVQRRHIPLIQDAWLAETLVWSQGDLVKLKIHVHLFCNGRSRPIVRYDHAHGSLHVHRFYRGTVETWHCSLEEALQRAQTELREHLQAWIDATKSVTFNVSHREGA